MAHQIQTGEDPGTQSAEHGSFCWDVGCLARKFSSTHLKTGLKTTTFTFSIQPSPKKCEIWIQSYFIWPFINLPRVCVERVVRVEMPSASDPKIKIFYYFMNAMVGNYKVFYACYLTTNKATWKVAWAYLLKSKVFFSTRKWVGQSNNWNSDLES